VSIDGLLVIDRCAAGLIDHVDVPWRLSLVEKLQSRALLSALPADRDVVQLFSLDICLPWPSSWPSSRNPTGACVVLIFQVVLHSPDPRSSENLGGDSTASGISLVHHSRSFDRRHLPGTTYGLPATQGCPSTQRRGKGMFGHPVGRQEMRSVCRPDPLCLGMESVEIAFPALSQVFGPFNQGSEQ
jgi:hypothetical protein